MDVNLSPKDVFLKILYVILFLLFANLVGIGFKFGLGHNYVYGLVPLFNFDTEQNIPTLYSSIALVFTSFLLFLIGFACKKADKPFIAWFGLSFIFLFLSVDEISVLHERLIEPVRMTLNTSGFFYYAWVIPYGAFVIIFLALYAKFLINLSTKIRNLFVISGLIYVTGAIGFELIGGYHAELNGRDNVAYALITTFEELLEMLGVNLFIYSLLSHIVNSNQTLAINVVRD